MADDQPDYLEDPPEIERPEENGITAPGERGPPSQDDVELVSMASTGVSVLHSAESGLLYHGEVNENGRVTPRFDDEVDVDSGTTARCRMRSATSATDSAGTR